MLIKRLILSLAAGLTALGSHAQDSLLLRDYQFVKRSDAWLTGPNPAALTRFSERQLATAQLSLTKAKGGLTDFYESPGVLQGDASVESFFRLSGRTVVHGAMSYDNSSGHDMAGSAFLHLQPWQLAGSSVQAASHLPFDIVEDSLGNEGTKHRDVYRLQGGVGIDVWKGIALGLSLDYVAANYAKYKDLRHKNKLMDMQLLAGIYVPLGRTVQLGANYLYHRTTESVQFSTYGKGDRTYTSFINYGPFIGQTEQFAGYGGFTDRSREMPLVDDCDGLSVQLAVRPSGHLHFYNAFVYAHRRGYYGRRSPYTITYTHHRSKQYGYAARLSVLAPPAAVHLDFSLQAENLQNNASNYRELKNESDASYYEYYPQVKLANRLWVDGAAILTADLGIRQQLPAWTLQAGLDWGHRKQTAYRYPYYRRQRLNTRKYFLTASHRLKAARGVWTIQLEGAFIHGDGQPFEDHAFVQPSDKQTQPPAMEAYLWQEYRWLTAPQYRVGTAASYAFVVPALGLKTFVKAALHHHKSNQTNAYASGRDRTTATLAIGCEF